MEGKKKVVYVDFRKGRKPGTGGFGGGPRLLFGVFLAVLLVEVAVAAVLFPTAIGSFFFAPTAIAVAVAATLGARRIIARIQVRQLYQRSMGRKTPPDHDEDNTRRTLH